MRLLEGEGDAESSHSRKEQLGIVLFLQANE